MVSGASGSGKTTLCAKLIANLGDTELSVSVTTRGPRKGEEEGVDYRFVDDAEFDRRLKRRDFAEWARVHGNRYGTSMSFLGKRLKAGIDVVCDVDYQGAFALRKRFKDQAVLSFILPPSMKELRRRLRARGTDSHQAVAQRLERARKEHRQAKKYDYILVNVDLHQTADTLISILLAERARAARMVGLLPARLLGHRAK